MRLTVEVYDAGDLDDILTIFGMDEFSYYGLKKILELHHDMGRVDISELIDTFTEFGSDGCGWNFEEGFANAGLKDKRGNDIPISPFNEFIADGDDEWEDMTEEEHLNIYIDSILDWLYDEGYHIYNLENRNVLVEAPQD